MQRLLPTAEKDGGDLCYSSSGGAVCRVNLILVSSEPLERRGQSEGTRVHVASRCAVIVDKDSGFLMEILPELKRCQRDDSTP